MGYKSLVTYRPTKVAIHATIDATARRHSHLTTRIAATSRLEQTTCQGLTRSPLTDAADTVILA